MYSSSLKSRISVNRGAADEKSPASCPKLRGEKLARTLKSFLKLEYRPRPPQAALSPARSLRRSELRRKAHAQLNTRFSGGEPRKLRRRMAIKLARNWFLEEQKKVATA